MEKTGVPTGAYAINPLSRRTRADLGDELRARRIRHRRRDGRARARRARFRFREEARSADRASDRAGEGTGDVAEGELDEAYVDDGVLVNSGEFDGMASADARNAITARTRRRAAAAR